MVSYVSVINRTQKEVPSDFAKEISELFLRMYSEDRGQRGCISVSTTIVFVTDSEMKKYNSEYRNKDVTTDVLSFCTGCDEAAIDKVEGDGGETCELGDILVSYEEVERNSIRFGVSTNEELARVIIHGLLHLLGHEHEGVLDEDRGEMLQLQEQFVKQFIDDGFIK